MTKGRRSGKYPEANFRDYIKMKMTNYTRREAVGLTLVGLASVVGINRGTLSQILTGRRVASLADRESLMSFFKASKEDRERFSVSGHPTKPKSFLVPDTDARPRHRLLNRGQECLLRAQYDKALQYFDRVIALSKSDGDLEDRADAHARIAWVHFEQGNVHSCQANLDHAKQLVVSYLGVSLTRIFDSLRPGSSSSPLARGSNISRIFSWTLHLQAKLFAERVAHCAAIGVSPDAFAAFQKSIALNQHLQDHEMLAHDFRWKAVFLASDPLPERLKQAENLLKQSGDLFNPKQIGMAYLARDKGLVKGYSGNLSHARRNLHEAIDRLAEFDDSRGMGPVFFALSRLERNRKGGDRSLGRLYALAGAATHPYYFVGQNARSAYEKVTTDEWKRDLYQLYDGQGHFETIYRVLSNLRANEGVTGREAVADNLRIAFRDRDPCLL